VSLRAPIAVAVEVRTDSRRVFRLASSVGEDGVRLERAAPFEVGRPVAVRFVLPPPHAGEALTLTAEVHPADSEDETRQEGAGGRELTFVHPPAEAREAIRDYVRRRLELPV
jgi:hypothetical protein